MAMSSDGELEEDLSDISSGEDIFESLQQLGQRKLELEIENQIVSGKIGKCVLLIA